MLDCAHERRSVLRLLAVSALPLAWTIEHANAESAAELRQARKVELLYSTKPIRVLLGRREYSVPANYFGPREKNERATIDAGKTGFAFVLFLPDYGGFTTQNWRDPFDRSRIDVMWLKQENTKARVRGSDGTYKRAAPASYGDPKARFDNGRDLLEAQPSFKMYGLEGYRRRDSGRWTVTWTGHRSNGEFFFFDSSYPPQHQVPHGTNPLCAMQYYSHAEDLHIAYRYSQDHIEKWREIDDAIWEKIHVWRVK
jgi:hypothetical protein